MSDYKNIPLVPNHGSHKAYTRFLEHMLESGNYPLHEFIKYANQAADVEDMLLEWPEFYEEEE